MFILVVWLTENFRLVQHPACKMSHTIIQMYPLETNTKTKVAITEMHCTSSFQHQVTQ
jgi:hypothetical protein